MSVSENANKQELPKFNHIYVFQPRYGEQAIASVKDFLIYTTADKSSFTNWGLRYALEGEFVKFTLIPKSSPIPIDLEIHLALVSSSGNIVSRWDLWRLKGPKLVVNQAVNDGFSVKVSAIDQNIEEFCTEDQRLTLKLLIFTKMSDTNGKKERTFQDPQSVTKTLLNELKTAFESGENSDVTVKTADGVKMKLHKFLMTARSTTFNQMFNIEMKEKETGFVEIKDFDSDVLKELFRFIYYGQVENLDSIDVELYKAAQRYDIKDLPEICMESIVENINKRDVVELLELADVFKETELFNYVAHIFFCQYNQIVRSEDWKNLKLEIKFRAYRSIVQLTLENSTTTVKTTM